MIIKTKEFKNVCSTILNAVDNSELSTLTETLELKIENKDLLLNVTNGEYYISIKFPLTEEEKFHASVNANLFLKLIAAITTEDIELVMKDNYLQVKANGNYKIPYIYEGENILNLPKIEINNPTINMNIDGETLNSISIYNSKEIQRGIISKPVQKLYYVDEKGCLTFTTGACVNYFTLEKPIKVLFNDKLVKLFKLFKKDTVSFTLGYDAIDEELTQTKVKFETSNIILTAILGCTDDLINSVPVKAIRGRAECEYPYNIVINSKEIKDAVNRLLLFSAGYGSIKNLKPYSKIKFNKDVFSIYDSNEQNVEEIKYKNSIDIEDEYSMTLDLTDLKNVLDNIDEDYFTLSFGNHEAVVIKRTSIYNIVPECKI